MEGNIGGVFRGPLCLIGNFFTRGYFQGKIFRGNITSINLKEKLIF